MIGFVSGGIIASFYKWVTAEQPRFAMLGKGTVAAVTTFLFCAFTGPVIVIDYALQAARSAPRPAAIFIGGAMVAALWSCCSGIVMLQFILSLRDSFA
jgi:hypothetical protein